MGPGAKQASKGLNGGQKGPTGAGLPYTGPASQFTRPGQAESNRVSKLSVPPGGQQ